MAEQIKNLIVKWDATWPSPLVVSRQHDNGQFRVNLVDYPEPENYEDQNEEILETINYYLVVWMKQSEDGEMEKLAAIQLPGPYWLVSAPYTQLVQDIQFQFYATSSVTGYIAHSAKFKGMVLESLSGSQQQSVIPEEMWDAYKQYIEDKIIGAGLATIDPTLSIQGAAAEAKATGDAIANVNGRLVSLEDGIVAVRNLLNPADIVENHFISTQGTGSTIAFSENDDYGYVPIRVEGGKVYSVNNMNYNNQFSVVTDKDGIILGKLRDFHYQDDASVYEMPSDAAYIYLCGGEFKSTVTSRYSVVLEYPVATTNRGVYNLINFPYNKVVRVNISKLFDIERNDFVENVFTDIYEKIETNVAPYINSWFYQYIDRSKWESGYYWAANGNTVDKIANSGYSAYPPLFLKAGYYNVLNLSGGFSHAIYTADGTRVAFSTIVTNGVLYLAQDATVYLSNANVTYSMLSTGIIPKENGRTLFVYGKYHLSTKHIFYVGSKRQIRTLKEGIEKATEYFDSIVMVDPEDFDLVTEFGQEYLDNYSDSTKMLGLWLKNRVHVIFASGARVLFNYTGPNTVVQTNFSPFNAGDYGFTLENAWVESKNCRYSVHDELNSSEIPYQNVYKHCTFIHDSSATAWGAHQAIGGGLGLHGDVLIEDCYASSVGAVAANQPIVSYHNATSQTAESKSNIVVKGCRFEGTFRCTNQGKSATKSRATVTNCSLLSEPYAEITITDQRLDNMELFKWNNEIRTT